MRVTEGHLADGREIFFYDEHPAGPRDIRDGRTLPQATLRSEARWDPLLREWVALASWY